MFPNLMSSTQDSAYQLSRYDEAIHIMTTTQPMRVLNKKGELKKTPRTVGHAKEIKDTYSINGKVVSLDEFKQKVARTQYNASPVRYEIKGKVDPNTGVASVAATVFAVYHIPKNRELFQFL